MAKEKRILFQGFIYRRIRMIEQELTHLPLPIIQEKIFFPKLKNYLFKIQKIKLNIDLNHALVES